MHYLCVVACDHRADLSRVRNQYGHWVCWMSPSRRTVYVKNTHTGSVHLQFFLLHSYLNTCVRAFRIIDLFIHPNRLHHCHMVYIPPSFLPHDNQCPYRCLPGLRPHLSQDVQREYFIVFLIHRQTNHTYVFVFYVHITPLFLPSDIISATTTAVKQSQRHSRNSSQLVSHGACMLQKHNRTSRTP